LAHNVIFGPVSSRRLGISLGIDIVPMSLCSFDCIYCELGQTTRKTTERKEYIPTHKVDKALEEYFQSGTPSHLDYVTFSGSGEPTLHSEVRHFIDKVKSLTDRPVAILTNSSLLPDPRVRRDILRADLVVPSLDAASQEVFERINRPSPGIRVRDVIEGIRLFGREFQGEIWLEVLIVEGVNDAPSELEAIAEAARLIDPTRVQIGTVVRPPSEGDVYPVDPEDLEDIASKFRSHFKRPVDAGVEAKLEGPVGGGAESKGRGPIECQVEIIPTFRRVGDREFSKHQAERIVAMLRIRPVTLEELCNTLGMHRREALKYIEGLRRAHDIKSVEFEGKKYYTAEG